MRIRLPASDLADVDRPALELERRRPRDDAEAGQRGERVDQLFGHALAGIILVLVRIQDFDRDIALEPRITRPIYLAHTAAANQRQDFVGADSRTRGQSRQCWGRRLYRGFSRAI
jgi:hypothetical protein